MRIYLLVGRVKGFFIMTAINGEMFVINRVALKKRAKQLLDKRTLFLILCFLLYGAIIAACFACCMFLANPIEWLIPKDNTIFGFHYRGMSLLARLSYFLSHFSVFELIFSLLWSFLKFFRFVLFFALIYPFSVCMTLVPVAIVEGKPVTGVFAPISKVRYFIEYMIAGAARFLYTVLWALLGIVPGIIAHYRYSYAKYEFAKNPEQTAGEALAEAKRLSKGFKFQFFKRDMSFIGWFVFGVCTCGIGLLYLICYYAVTDVLYYQAICNAHANKSENTAAN